MTRSLTSNKITYLFIMFIYTVVGFITLRVTTEILDYKELSQYGIYNAIIYFMYPISYIGSLGLLRVTYFKGGYLKSKSNLYLLSNFLNTSFFIIVVILFLFDVSNSESLFLVFLTCWVRLRKDTLVMELLSDRKIKQWGKVVISFSLVQLMLIVFLLNYSSSWEVRVSCYVFADLLCVCIHYRKKVFSEMFSFIGSGGVSFTMQKRIVNFGLPCLLAILPAWLNEEADKVIILNYFDDDYVLAAYVASYGLGMTFNQIVNAYIGFYAKDFFESLKIKNSIYSLRSMFFKHIAAIVLLAFSFSIAIYVFPTLFLPEKYHEYIAITLVIISSCSFFAGARLVATYIEFNEKTSAKLKISCLGAVCNLFVSIYYIPDFGIYAPALGTLISSIVGLILTVYLSFCYEKYLEKEVD